MTHPPLLRVELRTAPAPSTDHPTEDADLYDPSVLTTPLPVPAPRRESTP